MKSRGINCKFRKLLSIILICILVFEIIPENIFDVTKTVVAAGNADADFVGEPEKGKLNVLDKWIAQVKELGWFTTTTTENGVTTTSDNINVSDGSITVSESSPFWNTSDKAYDNTYVNKIDETVVVADTSVDETVAAIYSTFSFKNTSSTDTLYGSTSYGKRITEKKVITTSETVSSKAYTGYNPDKDNNVADELYYTIEAAEGYNSNDGKSQAYCRCYYVSTANQLKTVMYGYKQNCVLATKAEIINYLNDPSVLEDDIIVAPKVKVVLLCNIDLGGGENFKWSSYANNSIEFELDGQGYYIYNGNLSTNGYFLGTKDKYFAIHDVTFSNFYIAHNFGMFGESVSYAYFNNVNWENCVAATTANDAYSTTIVLGKSYSECYFQDCTIRNSYVRANASGHSSLFASFNSGDGTTNCSYLGDDSSTTYSLGYYYITVPELAEAERAWSGKETKNDEYKNKTLSKKFPSIYEGCATVDCGLYETNTEVYHSGGFVSCVQSNVIFKDCYSNTSIYGSNQLGVFIGSVIGSGNGFYYPVSDSTNSTKKTLVSTYFEGCYTSGKIEGKSSLGGFIGSIFNDVRAVGYNTYFETYWKDDTNFTTSQKNRGSVVFYNCYSTSSVGMEYSGNYVGGFVGIVRGNIASNLSYTYKNATANNGQFSSKFTSSITDKSTVKHRFINCYAAGEVGGITTNTEIETYTDEIGNLTSNNNTIGGFIGVYRPEDYYTNANKKDSTRYNVSELSKNNQIDGITTNCYYDMQTTGMRERDIGSFKEITSEFYKKEPTATNTNKDGSKWVVDIGSGNSTWDINNYTKNCGSTFSLAGTLSGLTGVYTQQSTVKQISGLTNAGKTWDGNDLFPDAGDAWTYLEGYYPQIKYFNKSDTEPTREKIAEKHPDASNEVVEMYYKRAVQYYYDSIASTSTVYLDHYDEMLGTDGNLKSVDELVKADLAKADITLSDSATEADKKAYNDSYAVKLANYQTVYDTVRDITSKFEFTSDYYYSAEGSDAVETSINHNISWATTDNTDFTSTLGLTPGATSTITPSLTPDADHRIDLTYDIPISVTATPTPTATATPTPIQDASTVVAADEGSEGGETTVENPNSANQTSSNVEPTATPTPKGVTQISETYNPSVLVITKVSTTVNKKSSSTDTTVEATDSSTNAETTDSGTNAVTTTTDTTTETETTTTDATTEAETSTTDSNKTTVEVYKCLNFAPGKQWVKVTASSDDAGFSGSRQLRLLPTVYLSAGNILHVNVIADDKDETKVENDVYYTTNDGNEVQISNFNHSVGVVYAITDRYRMGALDSSGTTTIYQGQKLALYNKTSFANTDVFAYYDKFNSTGTSQLFGGVTTSEEGATNKTYSFTMLDQSFSTDVMSVGDYKYLANLSATTTSSTTTSSTTTSSTTTTSTTTGTTTSGTTTSTTTDSTTSSTTSGTTLVRIYHASLNTATNQVDKGDEIDYTDDDILKWTGQKNFEVADATTKDASGNVSSSAYYYMDYYWRLNDGRYLTDSKLVWISASKYNVTMITGILNEKHEIDSSGNTAIDQFVTDDVSQVTNANGTTTWDITGEFPSDKEGFAAAATEYNNGTSTALDNYYDKYNDIYVNGLDTYYTKSVTMSTYANRTAVQWKRSTDYSLTTLIVYAIDSNGERHKMVRIDNVDSNTSYSLDDAEYAYQFSSFVVKQDPETKLFSLKEEEGSPISFKVESGTLTGTDSIDKYIVFSFEATNSNGQTVYTSISDNLEVIALFRNNTADVSGTKTVLLKPDGVKDEAAEKVGTKKVYVANSTETTSGSTATSETTTIENSSGATTVSATTGGSSTDENTTSDDTTSGTTGSSSSNILDGTFKVSTYSYYESLEETQKCYEVDDTGLDDLDDSNNATSERLAVLPGDTLTYRVKLRNTGYFESGEVKVTDTLPENCTYVSNSMKIYRQKVDLTTSGEYDQVELVASIDNSSGKVQYGGTEITSTTTSGDGNESETKTIKSFSDLLYSSYLKDDSKYSPFTEPTASNGNELIWIIPSISLDYEYYIQYDVIVDELSAETAQRTLTNTAEWSFKCHNGNVANENTKISSLEDLIKNEIFDIDTSYTESSTETTTKTNGASTPETTTKTDGASSTEITTETNEASTPETTTKTNETSTTETSDGNAASVNTESSTASTTTDDKTKKVTYTVTFSQKNQDKGKTYSDVYFSNEMPTGFTLSGVKVTEITKNSAEETSSSKIIYNASVETKDENGTLTSTLGDSIVENTNKLDVTYIATDETLKILSADPKDTNAGFTISTNVSYVVEITGTQHLLGWTYTDANNEKQILKEIKNKSQVTYTEKYSEKLADGTDNEKVNTKANSVSRIERLSNQVETDVVHLYYQINKTIDSKTADPSQSFLFKVSYFKNEADYLAAIGANGTADSSEAGTGSEVDNSSETANSGEAGNNSDTADGSEVGTNSNADTSGDTDNNSDNTASDNDNKLVESDQNDDEKASADSTTVSATTEAKAESVSYVRISCTTPVTETAKDGTKTTVGYTGSQLIQCDRRGIYVIEEVTGLSATDYDFKDVTVQKYDTSKTFIEARESASETTNTSSQSGTAISDYSGGETTSEESVTKASEADQSLLTESTGDSDTADNSENAGNPDDTATETTDTSASSTTVLYMHTDYTDDYVEKNYFGTYDKLPTGFTYIPAVYTYDETNLTDLAYHTVGFTNTPSKYAYLSSQAYAVNKFAFQEAVGSSGN